jgi:hypothetical protein
MFRFFDTPKSCVHRLPYGVVPDAYHPPVAKTENPTLRTKVHMAPWLDEYAAGTLETACEQDVEAHLLVCDSCFAAYVAMLVRGA